MTKDERLNWLKQIEKDIYVCSLDATFEEIAKSCAIRSAIEELEERKTGKWISAKVGRLFPSNDFKCSVCGNFLNFDGVNAGRGDANYCPNCGAKMEGAKNE